MKGDIAVVGAGPAGLAAALAAARTGARVICIDLYPTPGGQYAMQPGQPDSAFATTGPVQLGQAAARAATEAGVEIVTGAEVFWGARLDDGRFCLSAQQAGRALSIEARALVVAAGAMERPLPFPGWTLPGVIGAAAAQRMLKTGSGALPLRDKAVLAGNGAFLMAVAQSFAKAGARLDYLVEMKAPGLRDGAALMLRHPGRLPEAVDLLTSLRRTGATRHRRHIVTRALGADHLEAVEIAPLGADGRPDMSGATVIEGVGTLAIGYGFQPVIDLTTALGAHHDHDPALGGWYCRGGETGETSVPGLWAAGETLGIGGMRPARLSGQIAGTAAAGSLGFAAKADPAARQQLRAARRFAADLAALYPVPQSLPIALPGDMPVCRCEDVTVADINAAVAEGARETMAVKLWTRAGMGPCQGRICTAGITAALAQAGVPAKAASYNRAHLPLRPTPLGIVREAMQAQQELERGATGKTS
ncbi:Hydrogen cyanide synthase subunit HcnB [Marinibacterium anthonyi]|nr:Hydrogen cyanide synthase subunit HcnB [Marinibacterium anthonyi]